MGWFNHQLDQTLRILGNSRTTLPETNSKNTWKVDRESMIFRTPGRVTWRATWWRLGQSRSSTFRSLGPQPPRCHGVAGCCIFVIVSITPKREECVFCVFFCCPKSFDGIFSMESSQMEGFFDVNSFSARFHFYFSLPTQRRIRFAVSGVWPAAIWSWFRRACPVSPAWRATIFSRCQWWWNVCVR